MNPIATTITTHSTTTTTLGQKMAFRASVNGQVDELTNHEINRILALPVIKPMDANELEAYNHAKVQAHYYDSGWRLFNIQAEVVAAYELFAGVLAPVGVGFGKTLCTLMVAESAYRKGLRKMVLFVPSNVLGQLVTTDIPWARSRVAISYPIHVLGGKAAAYRKSIAQSQRNGLYIIPYSLLSTKDTSEILEQISPQIIIADEVHNLQKSDAARTRRVREMMQRQKEKGITVELVGLSGTITNKSIKDYYHLIKNALKENCPLPLSDSMANDWAALIDASATTENAPSASTAPIQPLVVWAAKNFPDTPGGFPATVAGFRSAYRKRLETAPGVVSSGDASIGTSLIMSNRPVTDYEKSENYAELDRLCKQVTDMWLTPNGDEIDHAIHTWKWLNELCGAGFYNQLTWPTPEVLAARRKVSEAEATDLIERAKVHHGAGQEYSKMLRDFLLSRSRAGLDTPFLVGRDMAQNGPAHVGRDLYQLWKEWKDLAFEGMPERDSSVVRVCPFKVDHAVTWLKDLYAAEGHVGAILWYYHQGAGDWLMEKLRAAGFERALHCPAGDRYNAMILDPANATRPIVASYSAHGTGKNLQHFQWQYFLQWPRHAPSAEQVLGRLHRSGQKADELIVTTNQTLLFDQMNFAACLNDALYIHQTTGNRQKLIYAGYDPLPTIFPPAVMWQRGLETAKFEDAGEQRKFEDTLKEKFGDFK